MEKDEEPRTEKQKSSFFPFIPSLACQTCPPFLKKRGEQPEAYRVAGDAKLSRSHVPKDLQSLSVCFYFKATPALHKPRLEENTHACSGKLGSQTGIPNRLKFRCSDTLVAGG